MLSLIIISCGARESEHNIEDDAPEKSFSYAYDMGESLNDLTLMNQKTIVNEWGEFYSRVNGENKYGTGVKFSAKKLDGLLGEPIMINAKIRKKDINSNTSIVATCDHNGENLYWEAMKLDSNFVKTPNEWTNIFYDGFVLPVNIPNDATVSFYFWCTDSLQVDIDEFSVNVKNF